MSLNVFGKVIGSDPARLASMLRDIAESGGVRLALDDLDVEDREAIEGSPHLRRPGVFFTISTFGSTGGDVAQLWIDAMGTVLRFITPEECDPRSISIDVVHEFEATQLGRLCGDLLRVGAAAGIALVDGGIEQEFVASHEMCMRQLICDVSRTWDRSPNRIYVRPNVASIKETVPLNKRASEAFRSALDNACGGINEAARLSTEIFAGDELREVRRELARLMEIIDSRVLVHLKDEDAEPHL